MNIEEEYENGKIIPQEILNSAFKFLRKATTEEKPINTKKGYSWYLCPCGNIVIKRNDTIPKVCNCSSNRGKTKLSFQEKEEIANYYKVAPITEEKVAEVFNISKPTVIKILDSFNITRWNKAQIFSPQLQECYFDIIDTQNKAYFLGLMITDGNIFCNYKSANHQANINLTLQEQDKYILEIFKQELQCNKLITSDGRGCCQLAIMSNKLKEGLAKYNLGPKKTFTTSFPFNINKNMYRHVLRGIIDGDGSIGFYSRPGRKSHNKYITLCSANKNFLEEIQKLIYEELQIIPGAIRQEKENLWTIKYGNKEALEKLIHYLYDDAEIFLTRKKEKCDLILEEISKYRDN